LHVTSDVALKLGTNGALPGELIEPKAKVTTGLGLFPLRMRYSADLCRGCARCIEVCSFDAFRPGPDGPDAPVLFAEADCRGCALCGAVCPTGALTAVAHSPQWWRTLDPAPNTATLACDTGTAPVGTDWDGDLITCRCVGQVHPGMLLDLFRRGTEHLTVVRCGDCRFGAGPDLAAQHVAESAALLRALGRNDTSVRLVTLEGV